MLLEFTLGWTVGLLLYGVFWYLRQRRRGRLRVPMSMPALERSLRLRCSDVRGLVPDPVVSSPEDWAVEELVIEQLYEDLPYPPNTAPIWGQVQVFELLDGDLGWDIYLEKLQAGMRTASSRRRLPWLHVRMGLGRGENSGGVWS